jgi:hypothetical protein
MPPELHLRQFRLPLERPLVMGIVNVTPDSFSDGGRFFDPAQAVAHARQLVGEGADLLDVGGESSRPGAQPVSADEELRRVLPVIEALAGLGVPLCIDTVKPEVMRRAVAAGASLINDIAALRAPGALEAAAESGAAVCLMHMQGEPRTMQATRATATSWRRCEISSPGGWRRRKRQASRTSASSSIPASASASGSSTIWPCCATSTASAAGRRRAGRLVPQIDARRDHRQKSQSARDGECGRGAPCRAKWG